MVVNGYSSSAETIERQEMLNLKIKSSQVVRLLLIILFSVSLSPFCFSEIIYKVTEKYVSIIQLLANPEKYDKQVVAITGYVKDEFENSGIYFSIDDAQKAVVLNGIGLDGLNIKNSTKKLNNKFCVVVGTFEMINNTAYPQFSGRLIHIEKIQPINYGDK